MSRIVRRLLASCASRRVPHAYQGRKTLGLRDIRRGGFGVCSGESLPNGLECHAGHGVRRIRHRHKPGAVAYHVVYVRARRRGAAFRLFHGAFPPERPCCRLGCAVRGGLCRVRLRRRVFLAVRGTRHAGRRIGHAAARASNDRDDPFPRRPQGHGDGDRRRRDGLRAQHRPHDRRRYGRYAGLAQLFRAADGAFGRYRAVLPRVHRAS